MLDLAFRVEGLGNPVIPRVKTAGFTSKILGFRGQS